MPPKVVERVKWEWRDETPSVEDVIHSLESLPPVWGVKTADYADFVLPMTRNEKVEVGGGTTYVSVTKLYMQVAGRVKMLNDAAQVNGWRVLEAHRIINEDPLVYEVGIDIQSHPPLEASSASGSRFGISRIAGGSAPWEKMETAARGRCLGAWGFGVLPGSGIASLDEMEMVETYGVELSPKTREVKDKSTDEVIDSILVIKEQLRQARGQEHEELEGKLLEWVNRTFGAELNVTEAGIDWRGLNKGKLLLVHSNLQAQLDKEKPDVESG